MREIVSYFGDKDILFPKFQLVDNKTLGIRNKIQIYKAEDLKKNYCAILHISRKSRFLKKDVEVIEDIFKKIKIHFNHNFAKKMILIQSPLCSKAKVLMKAYKWGIFV
jgi:hypothetical protein